jgi:uncharacterized protein (DUF305 family)
VTTRQDGTRDGVGAPDADDADVPDLDDGDLDDGHLDDGDLDDGDDDHGDDDHDDDVVVLGWWQHPFNIVVMLVSVALIAGMIGWMVGDALAGEDPNEVDVGFLQDMREHHEQAVAMGFVFNDLEGTDPGLRTVARSISFGQGIDIGRMIQMLRDFGEDEANPGDTSMAWMGMPTEVGQMPGMATEAQLEQLAASSGRAADELFVELMREHHLGGVHMAEYAAAEAATSEVRAMAASIVESQQHEITELEQQLD